MPVYDLTTLNDLSRANVCVIDFYATWCLPCQKFKPLYDRYSEELPHVLFFQVNVEDPGVETIVKEFDIRAMPTFVFIKNNQEVNRVMGSSQRDFQTALDSVLRD